MFTLDIRSVQDGEYTKLLQGPLMLAQDEETGAVVPLYHMMDPLVCKDSGYSRTILFKE